MSENGVRLALVIRRTVLLTNAGVTRAGLRWEEAYTLSANRLHRVFAQP